VRLTPNDDELAEVLVQSNHDLPRRSSV
jgi:hypothetical protein